MTEQRAVYDFGADALERAEQHLAEMVRRFHGPNAVVRLTIERTLTPEPSPQRAALTIVGEWLTLRQAGDELGRSWSSVKRFGTEGRLKLVRRDGQWQVHRTEVDRLKWELKR